MSAVVYFFSGTGNSLATARAIAAEAGAELVPIASLPETDPVHTCADVIGIIFPVYYGRLPLIVERFTRRLDGLAGKYVFAVATYGHGGLPALRDMASIVRSRGGSLAARYGVHLPQNAFSKPWENYGKLFARMKRKAKVITRRAAQRRKNRFLAASSYLLNSVEIPLQFAAHFIELRSMRELTGSPRGSAREDLWPALDRSFSVTGTCDGCGLCARVCPVGNITLESGRPVWLHHCENCLACYNWCPKQAVRGRIAKHGYHYRHPDMTAKDFMTEVKPS